MTVQPLMLHCNMTLYEAGYGNCQAKIVRRTMNGAKFTVIALTKSKCVRAIVVRISNQRYG